MYAAVSTQSRNVKLKEIGLWHKNLVGNTAAYFARLKNERPAVISMFFSTVALSFDLLITKIWLSSSPK